MDTRAYDSIYQVESREMREQIKAKFSKYRDVIEDLDFQRIELRRRGFYEEILR